MKFESRRVPLCAQGVLYKNRHGPDFLIEPFRSEMAGHWFAIARVIEESEKPPAQRAISPPCCGHALITYASQI